MSAEELKVIINNEPPQISPSQRKKQQAVTVAISSLMTLSLLTSSYLIYNWWLSFQNSVSTNFAFIENNVSPVSARIMGYVKSVSVEEGQLVKKEDVIAELDDTDFKVEKSFKEAKFKKAQADFFRAEKMSRLKAISPSDFEAAEAMLTAQRADLDGTQLKVKYTKILSPLDGRVAKRNVQPGQFVQPGQSLFIIVPTTGAWIKANFKETEINKIKVGMVARVTIDLGKRLVLSGVVESIYPSSNSVTSLLPTENSTGHFTKVVQRVSARIKINYPDKLLLLPGMSAEVQVFLRDPAEIWNP